MKLSSRAKKLGIHYNTAYRLFKRGQFAGYQPPTGTAPIEEPVDKAVEARVPEPLVAVYARVSSRENRQSLETRAERLVMRCNAQVQKVVKEFGSGIDDQQIGRIVLGHKDQASQFGVAYLMS